MVRQLQMLSAIAVTAYCSSNCIATAAPSDEHLEPPSYLGELVFTEPQSKHEDGTNAFKAGNLEKAFKIFSDLAKRGDAPAQYDLGLMHWNGEGTAQNQTKAVEWWKKSADQGFAPAQNSLAVALQRGQGAKADVKTAIKYYKKAADQGLVLAEVNLAVLYSSKKSGLEPNLPEAERLFRSAARKADPMGQYGLALNYLVGTTNKPDHFHGFMWLWIASSLGNERAKKLLAADKFELTQDQKQQIIELAEQCKISAFRVCDGEEPSYE